MALALPLVFLVGLGFYTVTVSRRVEALQPPVGAELFAERYSPPLGRFASLMLLVAMTGFSATYVKSLGLIFHPLAPGAAVLAADRRCFTVWSLARGRATGRASCRSCAATWSASW